MVSYWQSEVYLVRRTKALVLESFQSLDVEGKYWSLKIEKKVEKDLFLYAFEIIFSCSGKFLKLLKGVYSSVLPFLSFLYLLK